MTLKSALFAAMLAAAPLAATAQPSPAPLSSAAQAEATCEQQFRAANPGHDGSASQQASVDACMQRFNQAKIKPFAVGAESECIKQYDNGHHTGRTPAGQNAYVTECFGKWSRAQDKADPAARAESECAQQYVKGHPTGRSTAAQQAYVTSCMRVWGRSH